MTKKLNNILKKLSAYDYTLPPELIAQSPVTPRDSARLLVADAYGEVNTDHHFRDLVHLLQAGDILVINNTRVLPARLLGWREKTEQIPHADGSVETRKGKLETEVLLHRHTGEENTWRAFLKPAKKFKPGHKIEFDGGEADVVDRDGDELILKFKNFGEDFEMFLKSAGDMPLPPYIERPDGTTEDDAERYQTVYAKEKGAVAAPTAGLHFTPELMDKLRKKGIQFSHVTLHVGAGTFQPVREEDLSNHTMHSEWGELSPETAEQLNQARANGSRIICVGTTSLRLLETAASSSKIEPFKGDTDIFITPGFEFKGADGLITNFHLPKSTLMMLVAAFTGYDTMWKIYETAMAEKFRFYSYGDSSLLWRPAHAQL